MTITLYITNKKINSTEIPVEGDTYNCEIFEPCSLLNPSLIFANVQDVEKYNYSYIPYWNRYYFIRSWRRIDGRFIADCVVDVMSSWKNAILSSSQYVVRSASQKDGGILDSRYPTKMNPVITISSGNNPFLNTTGTFVIGVVGSNTRFYALTPGQYASLTSYMFSDAYADALIGGVWTDVYPSLKANCNPLQYISSVRWYPLEITGTAVSSIRVGWVNCPVDGYSLSPTAITNEIISLSIPKHPQISRGQYLNSPPYSKYYMYVPPWGMIPLQSAFAATQQTLQARCIVDLNTGTGILKIENESQDILSATVATTIGVPVQLAQITNKDWGIGDIIGAAGNAVSAGMSGSAAGGAGAIAGAGLSVLSSIKDAASASIPSVSTLGNPGGYAPFIGVPSIIAEFMLQVDADNDNQGSPLCQIKTLDTLNGYVEIENPHLQISATISEVQEIYSYMKGGFYIVQ